MKEIGVQVMGFYKELHNDLWGTLQILKNKGYNHIEVCSNWGAYPETIEHYVKLCGGMNAGWSKEEIIERLPKMREIGLDIHSMFIFTQRIEEELDELVTFCHQTGINHVIVSILDIGQSIEKCYEYIDLIHRVGNCLIPNGINFCLHNHEIDFVKLIDKDGEERYIFDIILKACKELGILVEFDMGWAEYAGIDASEYIKENGSRIKILHIKDIRSDYEVVDRNEIFVAAGSGICKFEEIFAAAKEYCKEDYMIIVDQDSSCGDILKDNIESARYLHSILHR